MGVVCEVCNAVFPENARLQHERGKKHLAMRFHGSPSAVVQPMYTQQQTEGGGDGPLRAIKAHEVPDRIITWAKRARELVLPDLVAYSGTVLYQRVCDRLTVERLCSTLMEMEERRRSAHPWRGRGWVASSTTHDATALEVLCTAASLFALSSAGSGSASGGSGGVGSAGGRSGPPVTLEISAVRPHTRAAHTLVDSADGIEEVALAAALSQLARALPLMPPGSRVTLHLHDAFAQRRLVLLFVDRLVRALRNTTGLAGLTLSASGSLAHVLDAEVEARLTEAATLSWHQRVLPLLMGGRAGSTSPLALLTPDLLRHIIELAARSSRTHLRLTRSASLVQALAPPAASHAAPDLGMVQAMLCG